MSLGVTVAEIFKAADLDPCGPVSWNTRLPETQPGVYVLSLLVDPHAEFSDSPAPKLPKELSIKWLDRQPVVYIGRTRRSLQYRIGQFYRHKYGNKSPHRGGQSILLLDPKPWVFWARADDPTVAERKMIEAFREKTNALPFGNRCRGTTPQIALKPE